MISAGYGATVPVKNAAAAPPRDNGAVVLRVRICPARLEPVLSLAPRMWIRPVGCDVPSDGIVLVAGETRPEDVHVRRRPQVGVLSMGNKLEVGTDTGAKERRRGRIPDANRPLRLAQLAS